MDAQIAILDVTRTTIVARAVFLADTWHEVFISFYSNYNQARYSKIQTQTVSNSPGQYQVTFSGLVGGTTYYVYAVGIYYAMAPAQTALYDIRTKNISGLSRIILSSDARKLTPTYGASAWGGIWKRLDNINTSSVTGVATIEKAASKNITGRANLCAIATANISGISGILHDGVAEITGRARIKVSKPEKLPEDWEYTEVAEPEEWEEVDKTNTGWLEAEKPEALEWNYPLEDTG